MELGLFALAPLYELSRYHLGVHASLRRRQNRHQQHDLRRGYHRAHAAACAGRADWVLDGNGTMPR